LGGNTGGSGIVSSLFRSFGLGVNLLLGVFYGGIGISPTFSSLPPLLSPTFSDPKPYPSMHLKTTIIIPS
jgi:hypothetical protein